VPQSRYSNRALAAAAKAGIILCHGPARLEAVPSRSKWNLAGSASRPVLLRARSLAPLVKARGLRDDAFMESLRGHDRPGITHSMRGRSGPEEHLTPVRICP
jgi:hypothetical protein